MDARTNKTNKSIILLRKTIIQKFIQKNLIPDFIPALGFQYCIQNYGFLLYFDFM